MIAIVVKIPLITTVTQITIVATVMSVTPWRIAFLLRLTPYLYLLGHYVASRLRVLALKVRDVATARADS